MNHFNALLNVLEIIEIEKETSKQILESYIVQFLQLAVSNGESVSEEDFKNMQEVAVALGLSEKEFQDAFENSSDKEDTKDKEYDKYDRQLDNVTDTSNFNNFLNRWVQPQDHDERYLY